jgi:hypothetical protein
MRMIAPNKNERQNDFYTFFMDSSRPEWYPVFRSTKENLFHSRPDNPIERWAGIQVHISGVD